MKTLAVGVLTLGLLLVAGTADAQAGWGCSGGRPACQPFTPAPWQQAPYGYRMDRNYYNPCTTYCKPYRYYPSCECVPECCHPTMAIEANGLSTRVTTLEQELQTLKLKVEQLEKKAVK